MKVEIAESDAEILACFPVLEQLRNLEGPESFLRSVRSQQASGYQLAFIADEGEPVCVAGFRLGENFSWGRYLYVEDLVSLPQRRSKGFGAALLGWLGQYGRSRGAGELHLDSGVARKQAHRFYQREDVPMTGFHFRRLLAPG